MQVYACFPDDQSGLVAWPAACLMRVRVCVRARVQARTCVFTWTICVLRLLLAYTAPLEPHPTFLPPTSRPSEERMAFK